MNQPAPNTHILSDRIHNAEASEILINASAGLALRGIKMGYAFDDDSITRTVLSPPTNVKLINPLKESREKEVHFSSKAHFDSFIHSLNINGYSLTTAVKERSFLADAGLSKKNEEEEEVDMEFESRQPTHFKSLIRYRDIPTAACELNKNSLELSNEALQELKEIDQMLVGSRDQEDERVRKKCQDFLNSYGSHVNVGVLHFGGMNKFVATYTSETESNSERTKSMMQESLNVLTSLSYTRLGISMGESVRADEIENQGVFKGNYETSELAKTKLYAARTGGPQEVNDFSLWKKQLVTHNSTWALIDRGQSLSKDFVGIWQLIPRHKTVFLCPDKVASSLKIVWETMTGYFEFRDDMQNVKTLDTMDLVFKKIPTWNSDPKLLENCKEYLEELLTVVQQGEAQTETRNYWVNKLCGDCNISSFLVRIMELKKQFGPKDVQMVRYLMRKLVDQVGFKKFPGKQNISEWVEDVEKIVVNPSFSDSVYVKSIPDLKKIVKERLIPQLQEETTIKGEQIPEHINTKAKAEFAFCIDKLLKHLESSEELHKMCFLKIALSSLHYDWPTMTFETLLTVQNLHDFVSFIEMHWEEYQKQKQNGVIYLEAFLINTLLTSDNLDKKRQSSEHQFTTIIKDLRQVISSQLNHVLNRLATNSPFNWVELSRITEGLAVGNMLVIEEKQEDIPSLQAALAFHSRQEPKPECFHRSEPAENVNDAFSKILNVLGLEKYYPSKMSLQEALKIKKKTEKTELVDLPYIIIQTILMNDYRARDDIWKEVEKSDENETLGDMFFFEIQDEDSSDSSDDDDPINSGVNEDSISTLDVLVAIFTCCDNLLRQTLAHKMFVCKLAIPFLYPRGSGSNFVMSLWALRTIPVTEKPFPLVTFVRLGRPPISKSELINKILSGGKHNTFVTRDCNNGDTPRRLTEGLVECSWFIPADENDEHLPVTTMFANLRGNATSMEKQIQIVQEMSSVVFIIVRAEDLENPPDTRTCEQILQSGASVILIIVGENYKQVQRGCAKIDVNLARKASIIPSCNKKGVQKNASNLSTQATKQLSKIIVDSYSGDTPKEYNALTIELQECEATAKECSALAVKVKECTVLARKGEDYGTITNKLEDCITLAKKHEECDELFKRLAECALLSKKLERCGIFAKTLENCAAVANENGIILDEYDDEACLKGKILAEEVIRHMEGKDIANLKRSLLPLQGADWMIFCDLLRNQLRPSRKDPHSSLEYQAEQTRQKMDSIREKQVEICRKDLSPFITSFIENIEKDPSTVSYFLKWMNLLLDKRSRSNLPFLREQQHQKRIRLHEIKKKQKDVEDLMLQLNKAESNLANASLGLENIFREIAQIYEAVMGCSKIGELTRDLVDYLPEKAAELLMKGSPLELMDGDASGIPLSWIEAVLNKLGNMLGEKKFFVLSILGIQSSGKSTLLNTMFGLEFAVSAGRCTRGAYMQLVAVDNNAKMPFDFIVVVDTEGLLAHELSRQKYNHDNELATFVIGLGDVTIINVKGENTSEIKQILEIVVHAFLRMDLVRKQMKTERTCVFVHQNVSATDAEELMKRERQKLLEHLDEMTKEAALSMGQADIDSFSQIINFDVNNNVWYFPDLWYGKPPMAPASYDYSEKVKEVKLLLFKIAKKQKTFLTPTDLSIRIVDLWNGVLTADFVFSFRNSLAVKAYNNMQSVYYILEWELQEGLKTWLQKAENKLKNCNTILNLEKRFRSLNKELPYVQTKKAEEIKTRLKNYFKDNKHYYITAEWEHSKLIQLQDAAEQQTIEATKNLLSINESCRFEISQDEHFSNHKTRIMTKAVELAKELKGHNVSNAELQKRFDNMWGIMVRELVTEITDTELSMDLEMRQILESRFHDQGLILREELQRHPLQSPLKQKILGDSITLDDVKPEHISRKKKFGVISQGREIDARYETMVLTNEILHEISTYLTDLSKHNMKFQTAHAREVIIKLKDKFDLYNEKAKESDTCTLMITDQYIIKVAVHVSRHCVKVFSVMQSDYDKKTWG